MTDSLILEAYRRGKTDDQTRREADTIEMLLDLYPPARLLDVPCGAGRLSIALAGRGYRVTGVDIAAPLLDDARRAADKYQLGEKFGAHRRDMRDLPWPGEFDGAFSLWESATLLGDEGTPAFLRAVAAALKPGARFVFDTHIAETMLPRLRGREWERLGDDFWMLEERDYDHETSVVTRRWTMLHAGRVEHDSITFRLYTYRELAALLHEVGFATCEGYSWLGTAPFMMGAPRLLMVAGVAR